jgi:hypothetical protein
MSNRFPELEQIRITVDETTRDKHLVAVGTALRAREHGSRGRGRVLALALVLALLVPVMALAAESTVPGDFLYPIKRAVEPIVQVFDSDAPAQRRVREVEVLFERDAPDEAIVQHVDVARDMVTDYQPALSDRIDRVIHDLEMRRADRLAGNRSSDNPGHKKPVQDQSVVPVDVPDGEGEDNPSSSTTPTTVEETSDTTRRDDRERDG